MPAAAMITSRPRSSADLAYSATKSGDRWAEIARLSCATPNSVEHRAGGLHDLPVALRAHDDADQRLLGWVTHGDGGSLLGAAWNRRPQIAAIGEHSNPGRRLILWGYCATSCLTDSRMTKAALAALDADRCFRIGGRLVSPRFGHAICRRCGPREVERGDLEFTIDATGTVEPEEVVDVGAQVAGKIESLGTDPRHPTRTIDYGSPVEVGTVLARIDDSLYQSEVEQAQAQVESAQALTESTAAQVAEAEANVERAKKDLLQLQAKLFQAERDWKRAEDLWTSSRGAISEAEYDLARFNVSSCRRGARRGKRRDRPGRRRKSRLPRPTSPRRVPISARPRPPCDAPKPIWATARSSRPSRA